MKILVTGGAGFIGSHLVDLLLDNGHTVRVLDNFSTGHLKNLPQSHPQLEICAGDIRNSSEVDAAVTGMEAIVHLAAVASVQASVDDPLGTHAVNLVGTIELLQAAVQHGVKRFVFASSAAVYGNTTLLPVHEETPLAPLTPYAADKLASEHYVDFYRRQYGLETAMFRFFNIFGPRQDPSSPYSGVISIFMQRAISGQEITVFGDGRHSRDFVFVGDLVQILAQTVEAEQVPYTVMNVGRGEQTNLLQLLDYINKFSERELKVCHAAARPGDIRFSQADNRRLLGDLGFKFRFAVEAGLRKTYDWYQQH